MKRAVFPIFFILSALCFVNGCARIPKPAAGPGGIPPSSLTAYGVYHTVAPGETLYRISKNYNVEMGELMRVNRLYSPSGLAAGRRLYIPGVRPPVIPAARPPAAQDIAALVGPKGTFYAWSTITVHHSATSNGSARLFDRDHRRRRMGGLFYHFVIGNGTRTGDGEVEVGFRWKKQIKANRPNDIQICLVGNFDKEEVSDAQFEALVELIGVLRRQYGIPLGGIRRHSDIKGKPTDCPGHRFPFDRLITRLAHGAE